MLREAVWMAGCFSPLFSILLLFPHFPVLLTFQRGRSEHLKRKLHMKRHQLLAALLCALSPLAQAETDVSLDEVVVTATRIEQPLKQTLSSTSVITQEEIKNSQASDVPTILRSVAGVEIAQSGGSGKSVYLFLRGSSERQVLVLLDGVRINSATSGTTSLENLMLDQIERIEVVRGNVSSLYGSEAIGGVVQIFTKRGRGGAPTFNASAGAGSHGTQRAAAGLGGSVDSTDFNLQVSRFSTEGVSSLNPALAAKANPDDDGYDNSSVSANVRHGFNNDHSLTVTAFDSQGRNQYDNAYGLPTDINNSKSHASKFSLASNNRFNEAWQSKLQLAQGIDYYQDFKNDLPVSSGSIYKTTNRQLSWQNTLLLDTGKQLLAGLEYLGQQVYTDKLPAYTQDARQVNSLFAGYTGNYGPHQLQTNLRQDNNSQYGAANTGLLGYGYAFNEAWRATASYSTAFRAPTFNELYYPGYGNSALKPEESRNTEAGLHYTFKDQSVAVIYFDNRTSNLINAVLVDPATFTYQAQNVSEARTDGLEFNYAGQFGDSGLKMAVTIQNPRDLTSNKQLARRAMTHSNLSATHKLAAMQIGTEWLYSDARTDGTKALESYHVFNLTAAYEISKQFKLSMRADNITDQNDSNVYGYNPLGRTFFASVSYQQ
jgi:vitamin B12 transporter